MVGLAKMAQKMLVALASLLTHPIDQEDLQTSLRAAASALVLATPTGLGLLIRDEAASGVDLFGTSLIVIMVWMVITSLLVRPERKKLELARNLGLVSIWIAVTLVLVMGAGVLYPDPLGAGFRFLIVCVLLGVLVPIHLLRGTSFRTAVKLILPLWLTMGIFAWRVIY